MNNVLITLLLDGEISTGYEDLHETKHRRTEDVVYSRKKYVSFDEFTDELSEGEEES